MPSLIDLRRRIRSVKNTQQITKAMKMVATARLRRAQERVINSRPFSRMADELLHFATAAAANDERVSSLPLLSQRPEKRIQLILVTADRGLAGAFNSGLIKAAELFMNERTGEAAVDLELFGRKGRDYFVRRPVTITGEMTGISQSASWDDAKALSGKVQKRFVDGEVDSVYLLYNEFKSILSQKVVMKKILPVELGHGHSTREYIFEQDPVDFIAGLLPKIINLQVFEAFLESAASEHAARMTAMDAATNNANDVINKLTLHLNRVRQASITREIIEVVSGASALE
jgi:F-type H+-transporting ATPase subunit gamma